MMMNIAQLSEEVTEMKCSCGHKMYGFTNPIKLELIPLSWYEGYFCSNPECGRYQFEQGFENFTGWVQNRLTENYVYFKEGEEYLEASDQYLDKLCSINGRTTEFNLIYLLNKKRGVC